MGSPIQRPETPLVSTENRGASSSGECGNCGAAMTGPFCSQCGEKKLTPIDYSLPHLVEEVLGEFAHFDSKFLRTLKLLVAKPGALSNAYFHGGRSRYTKPLTLFVIINVIFFLAQPHTPLWHLKYVDFMRDPHKAAAISAHLANTKEAEQTYAARFNANLQNQKKSLLIGSVPLLALVMLLVFAGKRRSYAEHLVFSVQVHAFLLAYMASLVLLVLLPLMFLLRLLAPLIRKLGDAAAPLVNAFNNEVWIATLLISGLIIYVYKALRRAYKASPLRAALGAFVLAAMLGSIAGRYQEFLFFVTLWTT